MDITYINKDELVDHEAKDFISSNLETEKNERLGMERKRLLTLIGLGTFYVALLLTSLTLIT